MRTGIQGDRFTDISSIDGWITHVNSQISQRDIAVQNLAAHNSVILQNFEEANLFLNKDWYSTTETLRYHSAITQLGKEKCGVILS